jgi:transcriptional regulator with XRE-family HTH domain
MGGSKACFGLEVNHAFCDVPQDFPMDLGERVAKAIVFSGQDDRRIATAVGVSPQAVGQWRNGRIKNLRMDNLFALADSTGFSARWIAIGKGPERTNEAASPLNTLIASLCETQREQLESYARYLAEQAKPENALPKKVA